MDVPYYKFYHKCKGSLGSFWCVESYYKSNIEILVNFLTKGIILEKVLFLAAIFPNTWVYSDLVAYIDMSYIFSERTFHCEQFDI